MVCVVSSPEPLSSPLLPSPYPHTPCLSSTYPSLPNPPQTDKRLTQLPKASSLLPWSQGVQGKYHLLCFDSLPVPCSPHDVMLTMDLMFLYLSSPTAASCPLYKMPILVYLGICPSRVCGASPPLSQHWNFCVLSTGGRRLQGLLEEKPYPQMLLLCSQEEGTQHPPT